MKLNDGSELTPEIITQKLKEKGIGNDTPVNEEKVKTVEKTEPVLEDEVVVEMDSAPEDSSSDEKEAQAKGWKPNGPKSATEFLRAEPLYDEIKTRGKEIKELKATLDEMKAHMDKQQALGYEKALGELKQQRTEAIEIGDVEAVDQIEEEMRAQAGSKDVAPVPTPEADKFLERNAEWINDPSYEAQQIREFAHQRDQELIQFKLPPEEHLATIEKDIKQKFATRFGDEPSPVASVESDSAPLRHSRNRKVKFSDLSPEQKNACRHFEKRNIMSKEEYVKQLVDLGEI